MLDRITINTDASFFEETKVAGYAFWVSCDKGKLTGSGPFKKHIQSSAEAEFKAIINALHFVCRHLDAQSLQTIHINSDNMLCVHLINGTNGLRKKHPQLYSLFKKYRREFPGHCTIRAKHVKAHRGTDTPRQFVNDWCDREAKRHARQKHYALLKHGKTTSTSLPQGGQC